ncbi:MAG: hypothetical protein AAF741_13095 [Bacteroidota bacterium]
MIDELHSMERAGLDNYFASLSEIEKKSHLKELESLSFLSNPNVAVSLLNSIMRESECCGDDTKKYAMTNSIPIKNGDMQITGLDYSSEYGFNCCGLDIASYARKFYAKNMNYAEDHVLGGHREKYQKAYLELAMLGYDRWGTPK